MYYNKFTEHGCPSGDILNAVAFWRLEEKDKFQEVMKVKEECVTALTEQ